VRWVPEEEERARELRFATFSAPSAAVALLAFFFSNLNVTPLAKALQQSFSLVFNRKQAAKSAAITPALF
jgi:hypothetical protein